MVENLLKNAAIVFATCFIWLNADAQNDTSYYDLGRTRIKKEFTQAVTIKGKDLEKFPATNLSDAINVWLTGIYTKTNGVIYVIDGDLINDVNAYSIFDIEELSFIENATNAINGVVAQQSMVVIKLRKNEPGRSGLFVAGQFNLSNTRKTAARDGSDKATYYQQYYLSAYKSTNAVNYGLSVNYQHDALNNQLAYPGETNKWYYENSLDRFKIYGYFDIKVGKHSIINASVNYVPPND